MNTLAYLDRWTARPGELLNLMVSSASPLAAIDVVRIEGPDDFAPAPIYVERLGPIGAQPMVTGSHVVVEDAAAFVLETFTFTAWVLPTMPRSAHRQVIAAHRSPAAGWAVLLDHDGRLVVEVAALEGVITLRSAAPLEPQWQVVGIAVDAASRSLCLFHGTDPRALAYRRTSGFQYCAPAASATLTFGAPQTAASHAGGDGSYNGKLARPTLFRAVSPQSDDDGARATLDRLPVAAAWDFSVPDAGLRFANAPRRRLPGPDWRANASFDEARHLWDAIGLNEDAVDDMAWAPSARLHLPADLQSGVYAVRLHARAAGDVETFVPFFVPPAARRKRIAVLLPTFTYLAYANHRYASEAAFMGDYTTISERPATLGAIDTYLASRPPVGPSIYDQHVDGTAVVTSSCLRPIPHMQPHYRWWMTGAPRHFAADLELLRWLKRHNIAFDVLTDHGLDAEAGLLDGYAAVLTGSHPEYVTARELDAISGYVEAGGTLAYLGGNGFYWVTERLAATPHRIEVRRRPAGRSGWETAEGEHILGSGLQGGLWADAGRPPERLTGVSLAGQGWKAGVPYRRAAGRDDPRAAGLFDGVDEEVFGPGAVGDEWDALVPGEEDNPNVIHLARSLPVAAGFLPGERPELGAWSDMVLKYHGTSGGRVFSAGSIAFLSVLNTDGPLDRILANLVRSSTGPHNVGSGSPPRTDERGVGSGYR